MNNHILTEAVVVVIVWLFDLQLPVQSVPITTNVVSSNSDHGDVYSIQHYVIKFVSHLREVCVFPQVLMFPPSRYNWNIVESGVKNHNHNPNPYSYPCKSDHIFTYFVSIFIASKKTQLFLLFQMTIISKRAC